MEVFVSGGEEARLFYIYLFISRYFLVVESSRLNVFRQHVRSFQLVMTRKARTLKEKEGGAFTLATRFGVSAFIVIIAIFIQKPSENWLWREKLSA